MTVKITAREMSTLIQFRKIVDYQTAIVVGLALLGVWVSRQIGIIFELPTNLIGIAIIFPLVFSIAGAYRQREDALRSFAAIKGHAIALYYAHRDWPLQDREQHARRGARLARRLFAVIAAYFAHGRSFTLDNEALAQVYAVFDDYSRSHEALRQAGVSSGEVSRANQSLRIMMVEFERMHNVRRYRTPVALRAYSRLFINLFPILFAPFFASVGYPEFPFAGYVVAFLYSFVLVSLDNIQDQLENPYDGVGPDDLHLEIGGVYMDMVERP